MFCPEKAAFRPVFGVEVTFLSGKMAKQSTHRNWTAIAGNRDAGNAFSQRGLRAEEIGKWARQYAFRHNFETHAWDAAYSIRRVQELLSHASVETTMINTHVLNRGGSGVKSPLDESTHEALTETASLRDCASDHQNWSVVNS